MHAHQPYLTPAGAQTFAARNLDLLEAVEKTLDALNADTLLLKAISASYQELHQRLSGVPITIDEDGFIQAMLEKASETCTRIYRDACRRHQSAQQDPQLSAHDGVADAYQDFITALRQLHDDAEGLREWIATHDALLEPSSGKSFTSVDELFDEILQGS